MAAIERSDFKDKSGDAFDEDFTERLIKLEVSPPSPL